MKGCASETACVTYHGRILLKHRGCKSPSITMEIIRSYQRGDGARGGAWKGDDKSKHNQLNKQNEGMQSISAQQATGKHTSHHKKEAGSHHDARSWSLHHHLHGLGPENCNMVLIKMPEPPGRVASPFRSGSA